jgi:hypothetical protein
MRVTERDTIVKWEVDFADIDPQDIHDTWHGRESSEEFCGGK